MENLPTVILLLFTDYLNNRDSLAFFRLSSSVWSFHRSPQGRYRLKNSDPKKKFFRPSQLPANFLYFPPDSQPLVPGIFPSSLRRLKFSAGVERVADRGFQQPIMPGILPEFLYELDVGPFYCGLFPLAALPAYFLPDFPTERPLRQTLKIDNFLSQNSGAPINLMLSRLFRPRSFLVRSCRVPISAKNDYCIFEPLEDSAGAFVGNKALFQGCTSDEEETNGL